MGWLKIGLRLGACALGVGVVGACALAWATHGPGQAAGGKSAPEGAVELELALERHVRKLSEGIGERSADRPQGLEDACDYIERELSAAGWRVRLEKSGARAQHGNLVADRRSQGGGSRWLLVSAPYASPPGSPGADQSASAVAALIELARALRDADTTLSLRFVAQGTGEEGDCTEAVRSAYLRHAAARGEHITAEIRLESLGCYLRGPGSQRHPFPWGLVLPAEGDFVAFIGDFGAAQLTRAASAAFRLETGFRSECIVGFGLWPLLSWQPDVSLFDSGPPCVRVSDTGPFRCAAWGSASDGADALDYAAMARVVAGLGQVVSEMAGAP